jgi:preprotein translocase subunit SecE
MSRATTPKSKSGNALVRYLRETRAEVAKVVWPTRREVVLTTAMVMLMATIFATFFFFVDLLIRFGLEAILNLAS